jgi:hypothetical protein
MIETIKQFKNSEQWQDASLIPHPFTWLNRGGWDDEVDDERQETFLATQRERWIEEESEKRKVEYADLEKTKPTSEEIHNALQEGLANIKGKP